MKLKVVYQPVAIGQLDISGKQITAYSDKVYRTDKEAQSAIPALKILVTTPQKGNETMAMSKNPLRFFIKPLEVA